ncbi:hypothetical protein [Roseibium sp. RKSG952]|uniref:hypothetical protein n=1 Tax=Roseibium sp. RKSG952 TaxID=2529384 RepID=UPI0012BC8A9F|nr:hypothetical protein [Roseibium sp. RKSG952]MTI03455.1 hypothetical protein [Roseibium sp. RKSG952]
MKVMSRCLVLVGAGFLAACLPTDDKAEAEPSQNERQACEAKGGINEVAGKAQQYVCILPLADAGKTCETGSDCEGFCLSETKQCSAVTPQFGCIPHLDETGRELVICID